MKNKILISEIEMPKFTEYHKTPINARIGVPHKKDAFNTSNFHSVFSETSLLFNAQTMPLLTLSGLFYF